MKAVRMSREEYPAPSVHSGERYGRLLIAGFSHQDRRGARHYHVKCDCGTGKIVRGSDLRSSSTVSCGCLRREKHTIHNQSKTAIFRAWWGMKERCENAKHDSYKNYGGRGIAVCLRWQDFSNFHADMGDRPRGFSLDRIDNDGPYSPENCRWASPRQQCNNKRDNHYLEFRGRRMSFSEWERDLGLPRDILKQRINKCGWSVERALTAPVKKRLLR